MTSPVQPLEYSVPRGGRPGIVTAIGIISIVVGCVSALAGLWGVLSYGMMLFVSTVPPAIFTPPPPATTTPVATAPATAPAVMTTTTTTATGGVTTVTVNAAVMTPMNPFAGTSRVALVLVGLTSLLGLLLAVGLIALGIMVLRDSRRALDLHWWYVCMKIPLVVLSSAASLWMTWTMVQGMNTLMTTTTVTAPGGAPTPPMPPISNAAMFGMMSISTVISAAIALAYPVALFFALRSGAVRHYLGAVREPAAPSVGKSL
jgi:uncharacterized membrane protein YhaH (DUF805 family)